jgi:hypothetical protein
VIAPAVQPAAIAIILFVLIFPIYLVKVFACYYLFITHMSLVTGYASNPLNQSSEVSEH